MIFEKIVVAEEQKLYNPVHYRNVEEMAKKRYATMEVDTMVGLVAPGLVFSRSVAFAAGAAWVVAARVLPRAGFGRDCGDRP